MNAPAAIVMSKVLFPETQHDQIDKRIQVSKENLGVNLIDAMSNGAADGLKLALNIGGMLLAFIAVIAMLNYMMENFIGGVLSWDNVTLNQVIESSTNGTFKGLNLEYVLGQIFRLIAWMMGVDWNDTLLVGSMLGQKTVINEFVAYLNLANVKAAGTMSAKSVVIATYALCGFSNFSSIAIQIGGIGSMAPSRQGDLSKLGFRALLAASLACMMTGTIAGALVVY
jgi:CNT family concentrative nucleoside transporter